MMTTALRQRIVKWLASGEKDVIDASKILKSVIAEPEGYDSPVTEEKYAIVTRGPFSYGTLEETYQMGSFGRDEPTEMTANSVTWHRIVSLIRELTPISQRAVDDRFNAAAVRVDDLLPEGVVRYSGGRCPLYLMLTN